ncbi:MAG: MarR family transcriptional regulator [Actinomycetota bacterium]|nr:MarR family transcriptional regulator [Actinomycetota bacterium]
MSADTASSAKVLNGLLGTLQRAGLSALELRVLVRLAERQATQSELADALEAGPGTIRRATRRLAMRGLIGRRFERRRRSRFVLRITSSGLLALAPLIESFERAQDARPR